MFTFTCHRSISGRELTWTLEVETLVSCVGCLSDIWGEFEAEHWFYRTSAHPTIQFVLFCPVTILSVLNYVQFYEIFIFSAWNCECSSVYAGIVSIFDTTTFSDLHEHFLLQCVTCTWHFITGENRTWVLTGQIQQREAWGLQLAYGAPTFFTVAILHFIGAKVERNCVHKRGFQFYQQPESCQLDWRNICSPSSWAAQWFVGGKLSDYCSG